MTFLPPSQLKTAVLFIVFNRLETAKLVFEQIRQARPPRLYIASDGPRSTHPEEQKWVEEVRKIAGFVDWPCDVQVLFHTNNLGCGPAVITAVDWFFQTEQEGIILEDDTVPVQSFFWFCEQLLEKYQDDERIGMIAGSNHLSYSNDHSSYYFSKNKACWGWATWRRSWKSMDFAMGWRSGPQSESVMKNMGVTKHHANHWNNAIQAIDSQTVSAWDWQWYLSLASQNQLTIFPETSLISNIGFGANATHTLGSAKPEYTATTDIEFPLRAPGLVCPDYQFDKRFENQKFRSGPLLTRDLPLRAWRLLVRTLK
jgi:hypothetical protein